jgi:co-chaperonin GroES (HSP10)
MLTATIDREAYEAAVANFNLTPTPGRVFVFEMKLPEKTSGGIIIPVAQPQNSEVTVTEGLVVACNPIDNVCKVGDHVFYARYSGARCTWKGTEYRFMNEADIIGVAKEGV